MLFHDNPGGQRREEEEVIYLLISEPTKIGFFFKTNISKCANMFDKIANPILFQAMDVAGPVAFNMVPVRCVPPFDLVSRKGNCK